MWHNVLTLTKARKEMTIIDYSARRVRKGKTAKDRANGAQAKALQNRLARQEYLDDYRGKGSAGKFPLHTCNGRKNRFFVKHKKGEYQAAA
jgi:hypothetical protein